MISCLCNVLKYLRIWKGQFSDEAFDLFLVFARGINCGCTLEPPHFLNEAVLESFCCLFFWGGNKKIMFTPRGYKLYGSVRMKNGKTMMIPSC